MAETTHGGAAHKAKTKQIHCCLASKIAVPGAPTQITQSLCEHLQKKKDFDWSLLNQFAVNHESIFWMRQLISYELIHCPQRSILLNESILRSLQNYFISMHFSTSSEGLESPCMVTECLQPFLRTFANFDVFEDDKKFECKKNLNFIRCCPEILLLSPVIQTFNLLTTCCHNDDSTTNNKKKDEQKDNAHLRVAIRFCKRMIGSSNKHRIPVFCNDFLISNDAWLQVVQYYFLNIQLSLPDDVESLLRLIIKTCDTTRSCHGSHFQRHSWLPATIREILLPPKKDELFFHCLQKQEGALIFHILSRENFQNVICFTYSLFYFFDRRFVKQIFCDFQLFRNIFFIKGETKFVWPYFTKQLLSCTLFQKELSQFLCKSNFEKQEFARFFKFLFKVTCYYSKNSTLIREQQFWKSWACKIYNLYLQTIKDNLDSLQGEQTQVSKFFFCVEYNVRCDYVVDSDALFWSLWKVLISKNYFHEDFLIELLNIIRPEFIANGIAECAEKLEKAHHERLCSEHKNTPCVSAQLLNCMLLKSPVLFINHLITCESFQRKLISSAVLHGCVRSFEILFTSYRTYSKKIICQKATTVREDKSAKKRFFFYFLRLLLSHKNSLTIFRDCLLNSVAQKYVEKYVIVSSTSSILFFSQLKSITHLSDDEISIIISFLPTDEAWFVFAMEIP